jgi:hypothetical protein
LHAAIGSGYRAPLLRILAEEQAHVDLDGVTQSGRSRMGRRVGHFATRSLRQPMTSGR